MPRYVIADTTLPDNITRGSENARGMNVFTLSELRGVTGRTKTGGLIRGKMQYFLFGLSPEERISIMQSSSYVQAVISSRMNRISSLEWDVIPKKENQDEIVNSIKRFKQIFTEMDDPSSVKHLVTRLKIANGLIKEMPELKPDLSNFDTALIRYKKKLDKQITQSKQHIVDWLSEPNTEDEFDDWIKKFVESYMLHGSAAIYKEWEGNQLDNFYMLPGGTVYPMRGEHVGMPTAYIQMGYEYFPKIYFKDEVIFVNYLPSAARSHGYVPLDSLVFKVSEQLLFDQFAAERADGTKEPEKLIVFGDQKTPFGDLTGELDLPMHTDEQKRIEEKLNTIRKGAIATISGVGHPVVEDISKADTFAAQSERQDKLLRDIALVFNMTNMEINLAGGEFTSGRETSETQGEIEEGKGTRPIIQKIETIINRSLLPYRFGSEFIFKYKKGLTELEQTNLDTAKKQSGTYTNNEIRIQRGDDPIIGEGNDDLPSDQQQPDGTQAAPFNMRAM